VEMHGKVEFKRLVIRKKNKLILKIFNLQITNYGLLVRFIYSKRKSDDPKLTIWNSIYFSAFSLLIFLWFLIIDFLFYETSGY